MNRCVALIRRLIHIHLPVDALIVQRGYWVSQRGNGSFGKSHEPRSMYISVLEFVLEPLWNRVALLMLL